MPSGPGDCHLDDRDLVDAADSGSGGMEDSVLVLAQQLAKANANEEDDQLESSKLQNAQQQLHFQFNVNGKINFPSSSPLVYPLPLSQNHHQDLRGETASTAAVGDWNDVPQPSYLAYRDTTRGTRPQDRQTNTSRSSEASPQSEATAFEQATTSASLVSHGPSGAPLTLSYAKSPAARKPLPSGPGDCHLDDRDLVDAADSGSGGMEDSVLVLAQQLAKANANEEDDQLESSKLQNAQQQLHFGFF